MILDGAKPEDRKVLHMWRRLGLPVEFRCKEETGKAPDWYRDPSWVVLQTEFYRLAPGETTCPESKASS